MIRLLIWLLFGYIGYRILKSLIARKPTIVQPTHAKGSEETVQDPVCKMYLAKRDAIVGTADGNRYYFCSMNCLEKFREQLDHTNNHT